MLRTTLTSYFAAALMMPYARFTEAALETRHDIDILQARFGASFEQVAHRLTTLQRPGTRALPFFLLRMDAAGNVSKRFSAGGFSFSRYGGACPACCAPSPADKTPRDKQTRRNTHTNAHPNDQCKRTPRSTRRSF